MGLFIGLMSGTSLDGVDAVLAEISAHGVQSLGSAHSPMPPALRAQLMALQSPSPDELSQAYLAGNAIAHLYADCVQALLAQQAVSAAQIELLGAHGQTVRHQPARGYTIQLLNAALLAELTQIPTAYDFRSRDIAAGGQGAPLVPAFHAQVFGRAGWRRAVVNIGGISNISLLDGSNNSTLGFDCGPGNVFMDYWCEQHTQERYDRNGQWASQGTCNKPLFDSLSSHPFLSLPHPKSTGRDDFHPPWLMEVLASHANYISAVDVQATLAELTAFCITKDCLAAQVQEVFLCGGGAFNDYLVSRIRSRLPAQVSVQSTLALGVPCDQVEALAFAWLAHKAKCGEPGNLPAVTGARGLRVLGSITSA